MQYLLDACSIINLLHIDEDEFLLKRLAEFKFKICKKVYDESRKNAFKKFEKIRPYPEDKHKLIEIKLNYFRERIHNDDSYLEMIDEIGNLTNYTKRNGELLTVTLSFFLNTFDKSYIAFVTDDCPAKDHFSPYFAHHKIGYLEDCIDLLVYLYRQSDSFSKSDLKKFLSSLYSEYAIEISELEKKLNSTQVPAHLLRNKDITYNFEKLKVSINKFALEEVENIYEMVINDTKRYKFLQELLEPFSHFFNRKVSNEYLKKIQSHIEFVESKPFYKFGNN